MAISGDFDALRGLRARMELAQVRQIMTQAAQRMGGTAMKLLADEFRGSKDPYGNSWRPLAWRSGKPLLDTGRMRSAVAVQPSGTSISITIGANYAAYHQQGAKTRRRRPGAKGKSRARVGSLPRRQMLPDAATGGLGPIWYAAFRRDVDAVVIKALTGRG